MDYSKDRDDVWGQWGGLPGGRGIWRHPGLDGCTVAARPAALHLSSGCPAAASCTDQWKAAPMMEEVWSSTFCSPHLDSGILGLEWEVGSLAIGSFPPRPYTKWVPGEWKPSGWAWIPGHWRYR